MISKAKYLSIIVFTIIIFSSCNKSNHLTFYGIPLGQSVSTFTKQLESNGWVRVNIGIDLKFEKGESKCKITSENDTVVMVSETIEYSLNDPYSTYNLKFKQELDSIRDEYKGYNEEKGTGIASRPTSLIYGENGCVFSKIIYNEVTRHYMDKCMSNYNNNEELYKSIIKLGTLQNELNN